MHMHMPYESGIAALKGSILLSTAPCNVANLLRGSWVAQVIRLNSFKLCLQFAKERQDCVAYVVVMSLLGHFTCPSSACLPPHPGLLWQRTISGCTRTLPVITGLASVSVRFAWPCAAQERTLYAVVTIAVARSFCTRMLL